MIGKIRYPQGRLYTCDDCQKDVHHFRNEQAALAAGWAVAHGRKNVWCPSCAPRHRHVGRKRKGLQLPAGFEQLSINLK